MTDNQTFDEHKRTAREHKRLVRRVQLAFMQDMFAGSDRKTISHIPANEKPPNPRLLSNMQTLENRYERAEDKICKRVFRPLKDISPWCYKCSKKYNLQVRLAECECE